MRLEKYIKTGQGANDYDAVSRLLAEVGFSGWISIEDGMNEHGVWSHRPRGVRTRIIAGGVICSRSWCGIPARSTSFIDSKGRPAMILRA